MRDRIRGGEREWVRETIARVASSQRQVNETVTREERETTSERVRDNE